MRCNMEHQIVGRWLQEEIGQDLAKLKHVLTLIDKAEQSPAQEFYGRDVKSHYWCKAMKSQYKRMRWLMRVSMNWKPILLSMTAKVLPPVGEKTLWPY